MTLQLVGYDGQRAQSLSLVNSMSRLSKFLFSKVLCNSHNRLEGSYDANCSRLGGSRASQACTH